MTSIHAATLVVGRPLTVSRQKLTFAAQSAPFCSAARA
jgi:hypothetical protein